MDAVGGGAVLSTEEWRPVVGYEGLYSVSSIGRVRSEPRIESARDGKVRPRRGTMLSIYTTDDGYPRAALSMNNKSRHILVHRLVAEAFIRPIPDGMEVNHIDSVRSNNRVENLEIVTPSENVRHAFRYGFRSPEMTSGERNGRSRLSVADVLFIREAVASGSAAQHELAESLGVGRATVSHVVMRRTWNKLLPALQPVRRAGCSACAA